MINLDNLKFVDGDFLDSQSLSEMIYENEGSFTLKGQSISFEDNEKEITINFEVYVEGSIEEEAGDYFNPGYCDVEISETEVKVNEVYVDGKLVKFENDILFSLEKLIEKQL